MTWAANPKREILAGLMCSRLYFSLPVRQRLALLKRYSKVVKSPVALCKAPVCHLPLNRWHMNAGRKEED